MSGKRGRSESTEAASECDTQSQSARKYSKVETDDAVLFATSTYGKDFNFARVWASKSPHVLRAWIAADAELSKTRLFSASELNTIQLATSAYNSCQYCMDFHSVGMHRAGVNEADTRATRAGGIPANARLGALVRAVRLVMAKQGQLSNPDRDTIRLLGISDEELYELVAEIGLLVFANYVNMLDMPVDDTGFDEQFIVGMS
eukprot:TRINITY_DN13372_c0_g1_i1.p1 TRINITY_DN13372_c0_g1~~TRINITY_DN13372_c0_g1_i1.p1  ORF type:complete len:203 (+),score=35.91 TRINITY_DN13372_c0_g1_i1:77-685(+)